MAAPAWQPGLLPATCVPAAAAHNEFSLLFPALEQAKAKILDTRNIYLDNMTVFNTVIEDVFQITLNTEKKAKLFYPYRLARSRSGQNWLGINVLEEALLERVAGEESGLNYLLDCHKRITRTSTSNEKFWDLQMKAIRTILQKVSGKMLISEPQESDDLYAKYNLSFGEQIIKQICEDTSGQMVDDAVRFMEDSLQQFSSSVAIPRVSVLHQLFSNVAAKLGQVELSKMMAASDVLDLVMAMCRRPRLGLELVRSSCAAEEGGAGGWEKGVLGRLLAVSILDPSSGYFAENSSSMLVSDYKAEESNANSNSSLHFSGLLQSWENLLKAGAATRHETLLWLAACIKANEARRGDMVDPTAFSSTAMFINLSKLLLTMSLKMLKAPDTARVLCINPAYFFATEELGDEDRCCCMKGGTGVHMVGFPVGATVVAQRDGAKEGEDQHGLISEMFFMAHCALDMGINQGYKELKKVQSSIKRLGDAEKMFKEHGEAMLSTPQVTPQGHVNVVRLIKDQAQIDRLKNELYKKHACLNTALLDPHLQERLKSFIKLSTRWLIHMCGVRREDFNKDLRLAKDAPMSLTFVPEFMVENIHHFLLLHDIPPIDRRQQRQDILVYDLQEDILHLLTLLMLTTWVRNPHFKAMFAKSLELLLPKVKKEEMYEAAALLQPEFQGSLLQPMGVQMSEGLFRNLPCKKELIQAIYNVYVDMEVLASEDGEALNFDEKFRYRFPLNAVLFYLMKIDDFREEMTSICESTHSNMVVSQHSTYLKFVNILINDGIKVLDESLAHMKRMRNFEQKMSSTAWAQIDDEEKKQVLKDLKQCKDMAINYNMLSSDNIWMLTALTKLSSDVFTHPDMVNRVADMLNFFLEKLTGKERKEYRVKDMDAVFCRPKSLLRSLTRIYSHLSGSNNFIRAIAQDGRSFHPNLFPQTIAVLADLGAMDLEEDMRSIEARVMVAMAAVSQESSLALDAPEEFLCLIMDTLMADPVVLPSGKVVDRSSIAKHLLTSPTDPYNREPMTIDDVRPDENLKKRIIEWTQEKKRGGGQIITGQENSAKKDVEKPKEADEEDKIEVAEATDIQTHTASEETVAAVRPAKAYGVKVLPRIRRDLRQLTSEALDDIKVVPDENDFTTIHVVITGPKDTPYDGGFFYFTLECPPNYPEAPPKALIRTTDGGRVRFNPNLYREGKVCLSILGTWSGPGWTSTLSLQSVLVSIQSLMGETPLRNEPGYDNLDNDDHKLKAYNEIISHEVVRVAYIGMILNPPSEMPDELHSWVLEQAPKHMETQIRAARRHKHLNKQKFDFFENKGTFQWQELEQQLKEMQENM